VIAIAEFPILPPSNIAGKRVSMVLAIAVHLLLAGFLFYGVRWQTKATDIVEVELVSTVPESTAVPPAPTVAPPPAPAPKLEPAPPPPKPDIAIKEKEKPKPPPKVEPARPDPFQEQLKRETEQLTQRKNLDNAEREVTQKQAAQATAAHNKAMADYLGRIRAKIRGNIRGVPPELKGNPEAVFDVTQLPSGEILTVRLKRTSGNTALDAVIERAILTSSPLPKPEPADLFSRSLELRFKPLDD
jgi:colicin import membrane protein